MENVKTSEIEMKEVYAAEEEQPDNSSRNLIDKAEPAAEVA